MQSKIELQELLQVKDRLSFLYLEHCNINRDGGALVSQSSEGVVQIPIGSFLVLFLGPGTTVSHRAVEMIADSGVTVVWCGEHGVRYYAHGRPLSSSTEGLIVQAKLASNVRTKAAVARSMYDMRFPGEDIKNLTVQQLMGKEGSKVKEIYKQMAKVYGVPWDGRSFKDDAGIVNKILSSANAVLYSIALAAINALGYSPGLGFMHIGQSEAFVYDITDLYKMDLTVPLAFELSTILTNTENISKEVRIRMRDLFKDTKFLERLVKDIKVLLDEGKYEVEYLGKDDLGGKVKYERTERLSQKTKDIMRNARSDKKDPVLYGR